MIVRAPAVTDAVSLAALIILKPPKLLRINLVRSA
jgi:hypothetical protein